MKKSLLVKAWREHKHLTQMELSKAAGIARNTINSWENGHNEPGHQKIRQLAQGLNITPEEFQAGPNTDKNPHTQLIESGIPLDLVVPRDIAENLRTMADETGIGADILIRAALGGFVSSKRSEQLSVLRQYFDAAGNQIEEMIKNLDDSSDQGSK